MKMNKVFSIFSLLLIFSGPSGVLAMPFTLKSSDFVNHGFIPQAFTCEGEDINPSLQWSAPPEKTQSYVLIVADPDAPKGTWYHWVIYNIPANLRELATNLQQLPSSIKGGNNSWGKAVYQGPCPPQGQHRYVFTLYALDQTLNLPSPASLQDLEQAMKDHIIGEAKLIGVYKKLNN